MDERTGWGSAPWGYRGRMPSGREHVARDQETDGEVGHEWRGVHTLSAAIWPGYDRDQARTDREIPVVVLERV